MIRINTVIKIDGLSQYYSCVNRGLEFTVHKRDLVNLVKTNSVDNAILVNCNNHVSIRTAGTKVINYHNKINLVHVSMSDLGKTHLFVPRVPTNGAGMEDKTKLRVCLADSIPNAISAIPDGIDMIGEEPIYIYILYL